MSTDQLFPYPVSVASPLTAPPGETLVDRPPGWTLVGRSGHPPGFHRIRTVSPLSTVHTACGIVGYRIDDSAQRIVLCDICALDPGT